MIERVFERVGMVWVWTRVLVIEKLDLCEASRVFW